jgi:hypothetical protein
MMTTNTTKGWMLTLLSTLFLLSGGSNIVVSGNHVTCSYRNTTNNNKSYSELSFDIDDVNKLESKTARISNIMGEGKTYYDDGRLVGQWQIAANCKTPNERGEPSDGIIPYGWGLDKDEFDKFSCDGVGVTTISEGSYFNLSNIYDLFGSISIKVAK